MHDLVAMYEQSKELVQEFIVSSLRQIELSDDNYVKEFFEVFPSLELLYECDFNFVQNSKNHYRHKSDTKAMGADRSYIYHDKEQDLYFSQPYISTATGKLCITLVYKTESGYLFLDFRVRALLERFDLIVSRQGFQRLNRYAYGVIGGGLLFLSLFVVFYGFFDFANRLMTTGINIDAVFKPIIALTLGLAVYDLGKTILDQEVLPKTQYAKKDLKIKTLLNFSVSIIIALLIEALLVVFKISIHDYKDLPYAAMFIVSLSILLGVFAYIAKSFQKE